MPAHATMPEPDAPAASSLRCPTCLTALSPPADDLVPGRVYAGTCGECSSEVKFRLAPPACPPSASASAAAACGGRQAVAGDTTEEITLTVNGETVTTAADPTMKLNDWLRYEARLKGTKISCGEGGCGACVVMIEKDGKDPLAVNSCLRMMGSMHGWSVTTVEGVGSRDKGYHPVQKALAKGKSSSGTQCGYCSPGMVMSMYSLLQSNPSPTEEEVEHAFDGNICRCTGYRPILDAMKTFCPSDAARERAAEGDIEELAAVARRPCHALACSSACAGTFGGRLVVQAVGGPAWAAPSNLKELLGLLQQYAGKSVQLVGGNTGSGVYKGSTYDAYIDVSAVQEMTQSSSDTQSLTVGAAVPLNELIALLRAQKSNPQLFGAIANHLHKIANVPVRNVGSWAGNLMLAHAHDDFPSDVFTTLSAAAAKLTIADSADGSVRDYDLATEFVPLHMAGKVIVRVTIPSYDGESMTFRSFKVMKRHVNAAAAVNMATLWDVSAGTVAGTPRIVVGGIKGRGELATQTAAYLAGKQLTQETITGALTALAKELVPVTRPGDVSAQYRLALAQSLLYKTVLSALPSVDPRLASAAVDFQRPVSSGQQTFTPDPSEFPVSEPMPKLSALEQAAGEARYTGDNPLKQGTLFGAFILSPVGAATVQSVDFAGGKDLAGVSRVLSAADLPGPNNCNPPMLGTPEVLFNPVPGYVEHAGFALGFVLADTQENADLAAKAIGATATFTDRKSPILDIDDAIAASSYHDITVPPVKSGEDINTAFAGCAKVVQGAVQCGSQYHFHMETQTAEADCREDGGILVHSATQSLDFTQRAVSALLGLPASKVELRMKRMGGAYGGKITRSIPLACAVSVAAQLTKQPVRCVMSLASNMENLGRRHPVKATYKVGTDASNKLKAIEATYYIDDGWSPNDNDGMASMAEDACDGSYFCPNWDLTVKFCKTNTPSNTACRAPGCAPAIFVMETIMDHMASALGVTAEEFRQANLYQKGQVTPYGQTLAYCSLPALWTQAATECDYDARRAAVQAFNKSNRWRKRGIAMQGNKYGLGWAGAFYSLYLALSGIDGTVIVSHGGCESGQGIDVKVAQVVAKTLGCDIGLVSMQTNTSVAHPNNACTGGSISSELCCMAGIEAATAMKARLDAVKAAMKGTPTWAEVCQKANQQGVDLTVRSFNVPPNPDEPFQYNSYGIMTTEVEIDVLTGETQILRTDMLYDNGKSLNYNIDIGQVEGGLMMGLGYWLTEEITYSTDGVLASNGTWLYKPPSALDIPIDMRTTMLKDAPNPKGVLGSKAVGEPPLCMACNVVFAVKGAISAALAEIQKADYFTANGPLTPEHIQELCLVDEQQLVV